MDPEAIKERIRDVCRRVFQLDEDASREVAFHMTDWLGDLDLLCDLFRRPGSFTDEQAAEVLEGFLIHAPNHVAAAAKLARDEGVADIFEVGAVEVNDDENSEQAAAGNAGQ